MSDKLDIYLEVRSCDFSGEVHLDKHCRSWYEVRRTHFDEEHYDVYVLLRKCVCEKYADTTDLNIEDLQQFPRDGAILTTDENLKIIGVQRGNKYIFEKTTYSGRPRTVQPSDMY